jgi:hypothetical protein
LDIKSLTHIRIILFNEKFDSKIIIPQSTNRTGVLRAMYLQNQYQPLLLLGPPWLLLGRPEKADKI